MMKKGKARDAKKNNWNWNINENVNLKSGIELIEKFIRIDWLKIE